MESWHVSCSSELTRSVMSCRCSQESPHLAAAVAFAGPVPKAASPAKQGVSLRFLLEFASEHLTGPMAGVTTGDLVEKLIMPQTADKKCRYTMLLKPADVWPSAAGGGPGAVDRPKVYFISHAFRRAFGGPRVVSSTGPGMHALWWLSGCSCHARGGAEACCTLLSSPYFRLNYPPFAALARRNPFMLVVDALRRRFAGSDPATTFVWLGAAGPALSNCVRGTRLRPCVRPR